MAPRFDLQSHSTCSDGTLPPAAVVELAARAGIELLALSDHDTVEGVDEAVAAGERHGVRIVPAAEISAVWGEHADLHVLGYRLDRGDVRLRDRLVDARADRARRIDAMAVRLEELGFVLDRAPLERRRAAGAPIGRPHLAQAVVSHPANAERLAAEGCGEPSAFLERYLVPGAAAFTRRERPSLPEAIEWIHDAGGVAVWAHPFWDVEDPDRVRAIVRELSGHGLDGVEAFYVTHDRAQTEVLCTVAEELDLLTTGSADFHGPGHARFDGFGTFELYGFEPRLGRIAA